MKIDFHTHIFDSPVTENRSAYLDDMSFSLLYSGENSKVIDHNSLLKSMAELNIDYAVAMGFPWEKEKYCEKQNKYFVKAMNESNRRIIPFGSIPLTGKHQSDDWAGYIKEIGLAGIGEIAFYNEGLTYKNADILQEVFASALKHSLPVCLHVSEPVGNDYTGKHCTDLSVLYSIIKDFPGLTIILAHWGGGLLFYELNNNVRTVFKNIYYDTAASHYLYNDDIFDIAVRITGSRKILFGSDYPLIDFKRYFDSIESKINNEEDKKNIFGENAAAFLKDFIEKKNNA
ncbi:MAG: amidohydrolase family protein [Spirochaetota bacterium]